MSDTGAATGQDAQGANGTSSNGTDQAQGAGGGTDAQGAAGAGGQAQGAGDQGGQEQQQVDAAELQRRVQERERENAAYRERIRQLEAAEQERQRAGMTEQEQAVARAQELERERDELRLQLVTTRVETSATNVAAALGFRSPTLAHRLLTPAQRDAVLGDDGTVDEAALRTALAAELKAHPELAGTAGGAADGGSGRRQQGGHSMNDLIRRGARAQQ